MIPGYRLSFSLPRCDKPDGQNYKDLFNMTAKMPSFFSTKYQEIFPFRNFSFYFDSKKNGISHKAVTAVTALFLYFVRKLLARSFLTNLQEIFISIFQSSPVFQMRLTIMMKSVKIKKIKNESDHSMTLKEEILEKLEDKQGDYISGETLASSLSVTRNAVWKAVRSLRSDGCEIDAVPNKGYSLRSETVMLTQTGIQKYMKHPEKYNINIYGELDSTNNQLKKDAQKGAPEGTVVIAERQSGGRGRLGRSFFSPPHGGIYMSILLRPLLSAPELMPADAVMITSAAAVAVCRGIEDVTSKPVQIKWVNDVYYQNKKICGILTEGSVSLEANGYDYIVVGIGINVLGCELPEELKNIVGALYTAQDQEYTNRIRHRITARVLEHFFDIYRSGLRNFVPEYRRRSIVLGKDINVIRGETVRPGKAIGINDDCSLCVRFDDGEIENISSGEVTIRLR